MRARDTISAGTALGTDLIALVIGWAIAYAIRFGVPLPRETFGAAVECIFWIVLAYAVLAISLRWFEPDHHQKDFQRALALVLGSACAVALSSLLCNSPALARTVVPIGLLTATSTVMAMRRINFEGSAPPWTYVATMLLATAITRLVDIDHDGFEAYGIEVGLYHAARIAVVGLLAMACYVAGKATLELLPGWSNGFDRPGQLVVPAFFLGTVLFGAGFSVAGLAGWLSLGLALAAILPALYCAPRHLSPVLASLRHTAGLETSKSLADKLTRVCMVVAISMVTVRVLAMGIFPLAGDGDVWVHYLSYQRRTLDSGSTMPGPLWYHFFLSKGAGIAFLASLLTDAYGSQIAGSVYFLGTCLALLSMLRHCGIRAEWAWAGVALFAALFDATFFKHHPAIAAYIGFFAWLLTQPRPIAVHRRIGLYGTGAVAAIYICFFQPLVSVLVIAFLGTYILFATLERQHMRNLFGVAGVSVAALVGTSSALSLNFLMTGLAEHAPLGLFWRLADRARFSEMFGGVGLLLHIDEQTGFFDAFRTPDPSWIARALRLDMLGSLLSLPVATSLLAFGAVSVWYRRGLLRTSHSYSLVFCITTFLLPAILIAHVAQFGSLHRILACSAFFLASLVAVAANLSTTAKSESSSVSYSSAIAVAFVLWIFLGAMGSTSHLHRDLIWRTLTGSYSLSEAVAASDIEPVNPASYELLRKLRIWHPRATVFALAQPGDPSMSFPSPGLASEPSHDLGPEYRRSLAGSAGDIERTLRARGVRFLYLSIGRHANNRYSPLIFTDLFDPIGLTRRFRVVIHDSEGYVLAFSEEEGSAVPNHLVRAVDLIRSAALFDLSNPSPESRSDLCHALAVNLGKSGTPNADSRVHALRESVDNWLAARLEGRSSIPENIELFHRIRTAVGASIAAGFDNVLGTTHEQTDDSLSISDHAIATIIELIRHETESAVITALGPESGPLMSWDARRSSGAVLEYLRTRDGAL